VAVQHGVVVDLADGLGRGQVVVGVDGAVEVDRVDVIVIVGLRCA
jgi:hypothetical protein